MNQQKTKAMWIGRKKYSKDKLNVTINLDWGKVEFVLLGITFNVNLNLMPDINLVNILENAKTSLKIWQRRKLTPVWKTGPLLQQLSPAFGICSKINPLDIEEGFKGKSLFFLTRPKLLSG